jgi:hypothetical protein
LEGVFFGGGACGESLSLEFWGFVFFAGEAAGLVLGGLVAGAVIARLRIRLRGEGGDGMRTSYGILFEMMKLD